MKSIVWLASYPKSGNTWLRIFLANYLFNTRRPLPINEVHRVGIGDGIPQTYRAVAGPHFDPNNLEHCLKYREPMLRAIVRNGAQINLVKTHNTRGKVDGVRLIPPELTRSAIYVLRNPLDVAVSFAHHYNASHDDVIRAFQDSSHILAGNEQAVMQVLGGWSSHVSRWTDVAEFPVLVLRYEDMIDKPETCFGEVIRHLGLEPEPERLARAIRHASFDELQAQEAATPFVENSQHQPRFFRSGSTQQWRKVLSRKQIDRIRRQQGKLMRRFGYA